MATREDHLRRAEYFTRLATEAARKCMFDLAAESREVAQSHAEKAAKTARTPGGQR